MIKYILFYETTGPYGFCSNFFKTKPLKIDGEIWGTTEQYFQAMKFRGDEKDKRSWEYSNLIKKADSPTKVKMLGTQRKNMGYGKNWELIKGVDKRLVNDLIDEYKDVRMRSDWEQVRVRVMLRALLVKFSDDGLREKLMKIEDDVLLVEHTTRDSIWADGGDGGTEEIGRNYLGKTLTVLSHIFKYGDCRNMSSELRKKVRIVI